jgi:hypothetical protein
MEIAVDLLPSRVKYAFYDLKYGIQNLIRWFPIIWNDRDWDWAYMAEMLEVKLRHMAEYTEKYGCHVGSDKNAREQRICAELLRRMREDSYFSKIDSRNEHFGIPVLDYNSYKSLQGQDMDLFCKIWKSKMHCWWE